MSPIVRQATPVDSFRYRKDVDWLGKTVSINRGVVKAIVDDVKSRHSARKMACADELLDILKAQSAGNHSVMMW